MLGNRLIGAHMENIDFNTHNRGDIFRAVQEGIACSFRYGLDIMRENGMSPTVIRAGKNNLFLSDLFAETFVNMTGVPVELYQNDGSVGAALGAGIGAGIFKDASRAFENMKPLQFIEPKDTETTEEIYQDWKSILENKLK
jgi:xylulokinase